MGESEKGYEPTDTDMKLAEEHMSEREKGMSVAREETQIHRSFLEQENEIERLSKRWGKERAKKVQVLAEIKYGKSWGDVVKRLIIKSEAIYDNDGDQLTSYDYFAETKEGEIERL